VLEILKELHGKGVDLRLPSLSRGLSLVHYAALAGFTKILDFAICDLGMSPNALGKNLPETSFSPVHYKATPFSLAVRYKRYEAAIDLITKHKAKAVLPGITPVSQPIFWLLTGSDIEDRKAADLLRQWLPDIGPELLDPAFYKPEETENVYARPVALACWGGKPETLRVLLKEPAADSPLRPLLAEAINEVSVLDKLVATPLQLALGKISYEMVSLLLEAGAKTSIKHDGGAFVRSYKLRPSTRGTFPAVAEFAKTYPDRRIKVLLEAAIQKEAAEKARTPALATAVPATTTSNAFEDPSVKVLTAAGEKRKAKKREQKKKAKAKKRAAAAAGAGKDDEVSSDSDSSGTDEEERGMDEEERMLARAPTFDLEKERAARKARAEAEAAKGSDKS
jgi:hypothetical protein